MLSGSKWSLADKKREMKKLIQMLYLTSCLPGQAKLGVCAHACWLWVKSHLGGMLVLASVHYHKKKGKKKTTLDTYLILRYLFACSIPLVNLHESTQVEHDEALMVFEIEIVRAHPRLRAC